MEDKEFCVDIVTNKTYFIEDTVHISFKFNKKVRATYIIKLSKDLEEYYLYIIVFETNI